MLKKFLAVLSLLCGLGVLVPAVASATTYAFCSAPWYWSGTKVHQPVCDQNRHMVRVWGPGGVDEGIQFDAYVPTDKVDTFIIDTTPNSSQAAVMVECPKFPQGWTLTQAVGSLYPGWERSYSTRQGGGNPVVEGAANFFDGWPGLQAFGTLIASYSCAGITGSGQGFGWTRG